MITVKCIQRFKQAGHNPKNREVLTVIGYRLMDDKGETKDVKAYILKDALKDKKIDVINLVYTANGQIRLSKQNIPELVVEDIILQVQPNYSKPLSKCLNAVCMDNKSADNKLKAYCAYALQRDIPEEEIASYLRRRIEGVKENNAFEVSRALAMANGEEAKVDGAYKLTKNGVALIMILEMDYTCHGIVRASAYTELINTFNSLFGELG